MKYQITITASHDTKANIKVDYTVNVKYQALDNIINNIIQPLLTQGYYTVTTCNPA